MAQLEDLRPSLYLIDRWPYRDRTVGSWDGVISTHVKNRTWPVCPWGIPTKTNIIRRVVYTFTFFQANYTIWHLPETFGTTVDLVVVGVKCGIAKFKTTPALVPTHSKSLQANSAVTLKQAALCCRMISSQPADRVQRKQSTQRSSWRL